MRIDAVAAGRVVASTVVLEIDSAAAMNDQGTFRPDLRLPELLTLVLRREDSEGDRAEVFRIELWLDELLERGLVEVGRVERLPALAASGESGQTQ